MLNMDATTRSGLIRKYVEGPSVVEAALAGITPAELDARPGPDEWSARQVVHHLADSETTSYVRLRRLLAEDQPIIQAYDEMEFSRRLRYERPIELDLALLHSVRAATAELLATLTEEEWARSGTHTESGEYSVTGWVGIYAAHAHDHAAQISRARAAATPIASPVPAGGAGARGGSRRVFRRLSLS